MKYLFLKDIVKMKEFLFLTPVDVQYGDKLVLDGEKYRVIVRPTYSDHIIAKGELE